MNQAEQFLDAMSGCTSGNPVPLAIDLNEAQAFLSCLGRGEPFTYQTFGDTNKQDRSLAKIRHGTLEQHQETLEQLNIRGAGVFSMINAGDGKGRKTQNVQRIRSAFVDLDGAPLEPVKQATLRPHALIESSPGKYHAYWRIVGLPLNAFSSMQLALARQFDGDPAVKDLPRVMRLPGFFHQKKPTPFKTRILDVRDAPAYSANEMLTAFCIDLSAAKQAFTPRATIEKGGRNDAIFQMANSFLSKGLPPDTVLQRLLTVNRKRCAPPLPENEVTEIWTRVCKHKPANNLLADLFNNPALASVSFPARWLYGIAKVRSAGTGGPFSLTVTDCEALGFGRKQRQRALNELLNAGWLLEVQPYRGGIGGASRQCGLYRLGVELTPNAPILREENDP